MELWLAEQDWLSDPKLRDGDFGRLLDFPPGVGVAETRPVLRSTARLKMESFMTV